MYFPLQNLVLGLEGGGCSLQIKRALFGPAANTQHAEFYFEMTRELIADKAMDFVGTTTKTVDIVAHVINYVPVHWVATRVVSAAHSSCFHVP